jgi:enoyl-CoA hydratase/carnithine racemase
VTTERRINERAATDGGEEVVCRVRDGMAELTLNRPASRNAISEPMYVRLRELLCTYGEDKSVRLIVLRSAVAGTFCAGADINTMADPSPAELERQFTLLTECVDAFRATQVPVVTVVEGDCLGAGCALVAASDIVVAHAAARFALPEVVLGLAPVLAMAALAPVVALRRLFYWSATGRWFSAEEAREAGLVTLTIAPAEFDGGVKRLIEDLARTAAAAQRHLKRAAVILGTPHMDAARDELMREMIATASNPAARKAIGRFLSRKK